MHAPYTILGAVTESLKLWKALAESGESKHSVCDRRADLKHIADEDYACCPLCEYTDQRHSAIGSPSKMACCNFCPVWGEDEVRCFDYEPRGMVRSWENARTLESRILWATRIANKIEQAKITLQDAERSFK